MTTIHDVHGMRTIREKFEMWMLSQGRPVGQIVASTGKPAYYYPDVESAWEAWCHARDVAIEDTIDCLAHTSTIHCNTDAIAAVKQLKTENADAV